MTPANVVARARFYLGRPFRHQGRARDLDCIGLILAVAEDLALKDISGVPIRRQDYTNYGPQPLDGFIQTECERRLHEEPSEVTRAAIAEKRIPPATLRRKIRSADVLTICLPHIPCHIGIVSDLGAELALIHAHSSTEKVSEHHLDDAWLRRIAGVFFFPEVVRI